MGWELISQGSFISLVNLSQNEAQLVEGSRNLLELDLSLPVSPGVAQTLEDELKSAGVEGVRVTTASPLLRIYFTKGFPWLAVIAAIVLASVILAILIVGWRLFTYVGGISPESIPILIIGIIALATVVGVYMVRK